MTSTGTSTTQCLNRPYSKKHIHKLNCLQVRLSFAFVVIITCDSADKFIARIVLRVFKVKLPIYPPLFCDWVFGDPFLYFE